MRSLRLRIAAILIGAIVVVVLVATSAVLLITNQPDPGRMIWPVASQIIAIDKFYSQQPLGGDTPPELDSLGPQRDDLTMALRQRLAQAGIDYPVSVYDKAHDDTQIAVVELAGEQLGIEFPTNMPLPREVWFLLGSWLGLVVLGVIAVSLFMAYRVTQPFAMLEDAVNSVGSDGLLPHIPERGSGEARQTASVINRLSERLRHAMESRMRLVAAAGHDLRTPMTRMRIRAEFLNDEDRIGWSKDIDELELIADSAIRLVKEEVSRDASAPLALDRLLTDTVEELRAQKLAIQLGPVDPVELSLPPLATKRALRNLLINAATHGHGGTASLTADATQVVITIADRGPGIPSDLLSQVFEPFFRAQPGRIQTTPGAGLGLAIAREIVERADGRLTIENGAQGGLVQTIRYDRQRFQAAGSA
ncbi:Signal transduction histidine kinase [Devosia sp. YR412]|uniref:HAMP domain-containing sensor histidine kinase n=1 Tax=Devosia sp. YR412 TaxID=1881030 RepID=UPI0008C1E690|nr:ATP-binding protein [Devosia sp. YR412]SEQ52553.1 Signal transduction histidine kinase [Devosia sp. YR412]